MAARRFPCSLCKGQTQALYARRRLPLGARDWVKVGTACKACGDIQMVLGWRLLLAP